MVARVKVIGDVEIENLVDKDVAAVGEVLFRLIRLLVTGFKLTDSLLRIKLHRGLSVKLLLQIRQFDDTPPRLSLSFVQEWLLSLVYG